MIENKSKYWQALLIPILPVAMLAWTVKSDIREFKNLAPFAQTTGSVSKLDCGNHGNYHVIYEVDGTTYTEMAGNLYLNGECRELKVNDLVTVWASQKDAKFISLISPERALKDMVAESRTIILCYPLFALFLLGGATFRERKVLNANGRIT